MADRTGTEFHPVRMVSVAAIPFLVLVALYVSNVPIGQPFFLIYRYSPFLGVRIPTALMGLLIASMGLYALFHALRSSDRPRGLTSAVILLSYASVAAWTLFAAPHYAAQHVFNMLSPSHDGAFVLESRPSLSVREYVSRSFFERLKLAPEEMGGRRVLSNPPGVTVAAVMARRVVRSVPPVERAIAWGFELEELENRDQRYEFATAILLTIVFTFCWAAAVLPAYGLARLRLPAGAAIVVAVGSVFNPATLCFTPGKDPAQLLGVLSILLFWMLAYERRKALWGMAAGAVTLAASMIGLIHIWVFGIVAMATLWHATFTGSRGTWLRRCAGPGVVGASVVASLAYLALDWNVPLTLYAVAKRYGEIQLPILTDPIYWMFIGLPMFFLFVGSILWVEVVAFRAPIADETAALGRRILVCTIAAMTYSYLFANNSETPRLWIPFIPLLIWGLALRRAALRTDSTSHRRVWVLLVALQVVFTLGHWCFMDARESEWRLTTGRMWN